MTTSEYRFERFSDEKFDDLIQLFRSGDRYFSRAFFKKKFNTSYTGISNVGYMAYQINSGTPVAFICVFPVFLQVDGNEILAAQTGDAITHPLHRKKGLFILLAKKTFDLCRVLGIRIVFTFPNNNSAHGFFRKLNFVEDGKINRYSIILNSGIIQKLIQKILPENYFKWRFKSFNEWTPPATCDNQISVMRNLAYRNYKLFNEKYVYVRNEVSITFKINHGLHIGNIYFHKKLSSDELLKIINQLARITFSNQVVMFFSEFMNEHSYLLKPYLCNDGFFRTGRLNLEPGFESKHLVFSFEDFDTF
ncbi:MAG: hypothetical protein RLZZ46_1320 [Bacteroidota bacterium]|jgi:GNAT superfamily N-acetyltransferase